MTEAKLKIEPTEDEKRNGWTPETLAAYLAERAKVQSGVIQRDPQYRAPKRPAAANSKYNVHRWRG